MGSYFLIVWGDEKILKIYSGNGCIILYMQLMPPIVYLQYIKWQISCYNYNKNFLNEIHYLSPPSTLKKKAEPSTV